MKIARFETQKLVNEAMERAMEEANRAIESGKVLVCANTNAPFEIFRAMGFAVLGAEKYSISCATHQVSQQLCEAAESREYGSDICSWARTYLGSCFSGGKLSPTGPLPKPDFFYAVTDCGQRVPWLAAMAKYYRVPLIALHIPILHDGIGKQEEREAIKYVTEQLKEHIEFMQQLAGRRMNCDRLQECVQNSGDAARLIAEIHEMAKHVPAPITCFDLFPMLGAYSLWRGAPETIEVYRQVKAETEDRLRKGITTLGEEKYRLYYHNIPVFSHYSHAVKKFGSYGAAIIFGHISWSLISRSLTLEASRPLESIARGQLQNWYARGIEYRTKELSKIVSDYSIDGLVMHLTRTCYYANTDTVALTKGVKARTGVPAMSYEGDQGDPRLFSEEEANIRIDSFMEMLGTRKKVRN